MNLFVTRELTVQESIWLQKAQRDNDLESLVLLMESRLNESINLRVMSASEFIPLIKECADGCNQGDNGMLKALNDMADQL